LTAEASCTVWQDPNALAAMGGGGMPSAEQMQQVQQQQQQQKEMRDKVLESLLTPEAMDRIKRIALVKEEKVGHVFHVAPLPRMFCHVPSEPYLTAYLYMSLRHVVWRIT
jgi:hypothetical protein